MSSHHPRAPLPIPKTAAEVRSMGEDRPPLEQPSATSPNDPFTVTRCRTCNRLCFYGDSCAECSPPPGNGGVTIQKVEIVVSGGSDPARVARAVHAEIAKLGENRRTRRFSRDYTAIDNPQTQDLNERALVNGLKRLHTRTWWQVLWAQIRGEA
jgi:hypothetical protein